MLLNFIRLFTATNGREMHRVINTHLEAIKIGRQIAEQALDSHRKLKDSGKFFKVIFLLPANCIESHPCHLNDSTWTIMSV